jgi:hypothetical protein
MGFRLAATLLETMDVVDTELESLEATLLRNSALAMRTLRSATTACAQRDAARAHVVLAFEPSARRNHPAIEVAARTLAADGAASDEERRRARAVMRYQVQVERMVDLAMLVAEVGRFAGRPGGRLVSEESIAALCSRSGAVQVAAERSLESESLAASANELSELLYLAEPVAIDVRRAADREGRLCLAS